MLKKSVVAAVALALSATGCGGGSGRAAARLEIGYFQGAVARPEAVIAANEDLASAMGDPIELRPLDSGVAGMAQLRAGAFPVISGVGNPPFVGAFAAGTDVRAVFVESIEQAGLAVNDKIKSPGDLTKVGVLVGSTLDFQLRGWLKTQNLTGKVEVASFASEAAEVAAWKAGKIDSVFISQAYLLELKKRGARVIVTASEIARAGHAAVDLLAVSTSYAREHPDVVQRLVCQVAKAQTLVKGDQAERYIRPAARYLGAAPEDAVAATKDYPYIPEAEETSWLKGPDGTSGSGRLAQNFRLTAEFLVAQGRATSVPAAGEIAVHIDPSFWDKARSGGCS
jgi:NitT/TauT family transport system substrate-binding protein